MSKDIKKALEHCVEWNCDNCPNGDELGSGETVCRGRLLPEVLEYVADIEAKLAKSKQEANNWKQRFESSEERNKQMTDNGVKALELKNEKIKELKQQLAEKDEQIKELEIAFELCYVKMLYITKEYTNLSAIPSKEHFKQQAKEMLDNE